MSKPFGSFSLQGKAIRAMYSSDDGPLFPLFVYGQLLDPSRPRNITARGELRLRDGDDAAARFGPQYTGFVKGQVVWHTLEEIQALCTSERPEYDLQTVVVSSQLECYVFADVEAGFEDEVQITSGDFLEPRDMGDEV